MSQELSELQRTVKYCRDAAITYRHSIFWLIATGLLLFVILQVKEVASLLLLSYGIALLFDPIVRRMNAWISRGASVILLELGALVIVFGLVLLVVPLFFQEYQVLLKNLPTYLQSLADSLSELLELWLGIELKIEKDTIINSVREYTSAFGVEQLRGLTKAGFGALLRGYSIALTTLNILLLPFFVFYIARDLPRIHQAIASFLSSNVRTRVAGIGGEILEHTHAFFRGQITVCVILSVLYSLGLLIVGVPSAFVIGLVTGLLNIIPYLGVALGVLLAFSITAVTDPSVSQFLAVGAVFFTVQLLEGSFITPKIVGESVGVHPLGVMLALIIGAELFGLFGLIAGIPAAASIRVFYRHLMAMLDGDEETPTLPNVAVTDGLTAVVDSSKQTTSNDTSGS